MIFKLMNYDDLMGKCQTLLAITEVTRQMFDSNVDFFRTMPKDFPRLLTISIGTGAARMDEKFDIKKAKKWGMVDWLLHGGMAPLIEIFTQASTDMVDIHTSLIFQALQSQDNYLRIQVINIDIDITINYLSYMYV